MVSVVQRERASKNLRHLQDADHRRGCAQFAYDRQSVPLIAVLPGDRWWRRGDPRCRRAGSRLLAKACPWPEQGPVYLLGTGESVDAPMVSSPVIPAESGNPGPQGFEPSPWTPLPRGVTITPRGDAGAFIAEHNTAPGR